MSVTIDLMNVLYFVIAYLFVGYFAMLAVAFYDIYFQLSHWDDKDKRGLMMKALYRAALFSWAFPYAVFDTVKTVRSSRISSKLHNSVFVDSDGEKHDYKTLCVKYAESLGMDLNKSEANFWAMGKQKQVWKFAKDNFTIVPA